MTKLKHFSDWRTMDESRADAFNEAMENMGCPFRIKQFTPEQATAIIADNEKLLQQYGNSQRMAGDEVGETTQASRPNCIHLIRRMQSGEWRWHISKMSKLPNGGYNDGISRLLSCAASNTPFWTLVWEEAQADDFQYFDEGLASRTHKDTLLNNDPDLADRAASIKAQVLPRLYTELYGGNHTSVAADQLVVLEKEYAEEIADGVNYVIKNKPPRPKLIARAYIVHVGINKNFVAEALLDAWTLGVDGSNNGREMFKLGLLVKQNTRRLHDEKIYPAVLAAISAAEEGLNFEFKQIKTKVDGEPQVTEITCVVKRPRKSKSAAAGRV